MNLSKILSLLSFSIYLFSISESVAGLITYENTQYEDPVVSHSSNPPFKRKINIDYSDNTPLKTLCELIQLANLKIMQ